MYKCKNCNSVNVKIHTDEIEINQKYLKFTAKVKSCVCADCNREFIPKELIIENEHTIKTARIKQLESKHGFCITGVIL